MSMGSNVFSDVTFIRFLKYWFSSFIEVMMRVNGCTINKSTVAEPLRMFSAQIDIVAFPQYNVLLPFEFLYLLVSDIHYYSHAFGHQFGYLLVIVF